jgi:hypothetical protein
MKNLGILIFIVLVQFIPSSSTRKIDCLTPYTEVVKPSRTFLSNNTIPENHSFLFSFSSIFTEEEDDEKDKNETENDINHCEDVTHLHHTVFFFKNSKTNFLTHSGDLSQAFVNQIFSPPESNCYIKRS